MNFSDNSRHRILEDDGKRHKSCTILRSCDIAQIMNPATAYRLHIGITHISPIHIIMGLPGTVDQWLTTLNQ